MLYDNIFNAKHIKTLHAPIVEHALKFISGAYIIIRKPPPFIHELLQ